VLAIGFLTSLWHEKRAPWICGGGGGISGEKYFWHDYAIEMTKLSYQENVKVSLYLTNYHDILYLIKHHAMKAYGGV
jgi:hypothetical protein